MGPAITTLRNALLFSLLAAWLHCAQADEAAGPVLRPEVGQPIQAAVEALKAHKGADALARLREAEAVGDRSDYENYLIGRIKGPAAAIADEPATAIGALEAVLASPLLPAADRAALLATLASEYYAIKNYLQAAAVCDRYYAEGGSDPTLRRLQIQAYYLGGDVAHATREIQDEIQAAEKDGKAPGEQLLQMAADLAQRRNDRPAQIAAYEKLVALYPKPDYTANLVYLVTTMDGPSPQLALDVLRIRLATGTLSSAGEYVEAAERALQDGFPAEAKKFLDAGYAAKVLGVGPDKDRQARLLDSATRKQAEDGKSLRAGGAQLPATASSEAWLNTGLNFVLNGQAETGLPMMERAIGTGGFKRPDEALLHLGFAQVLAGQKDKGIDTLKRVKGNDLTAGLARLWILVASR